MIIRHDMSMSRNDVGSGLIYVLSNDMVIRGNWRQLRAYSTRHMRALLGNWRHHRAHVAHWGNKATRVFLSFSLYKISRLDRLALPRGALSCHTVPSIAISLIMSIASSEQG